MKLLLSVFLGSFLVSGFAFSSTGKVFCKDDNGVKNVLDDNGWQCRGEFLFGGNGNACFTGSRSEAIAILNSLEDLGYFYGTDGEYITDAYYKGSKEISYTMVDQANEWTEKGSLARCTASFFRD